MPSVFDIALEKRFTDSPEIATINVTSADTLLIRDSSSGAVMRLPFSTLSDAISSAFSSSFASLDGSGKVPASQLPSYVDDALEYADIGAFPSTGESGKIYISIATGFCYRWTGSIYVEISSSPGSTDAVVEGAINKYFTDARSRAAVSASGSLSYNPTTGVFSFTDAVTSVAGKTGAVTLAKADISGLGTASEKDYTEGTWTPAWNGGTLTVNRAVFTEMGRIVVCQIDVLLGTSASSSECQVSLPRTPSAGFHVGVMNYTDHSTTIQPNIDFGFGANVVFRSNISAGNLQCSELSGKRLIFTTIYTK